MNKSQQKHLIWSERIDILQWLEMRRKELVQMEAISIAAADWDTATRYRARIAEVDLIARHIRSVMLEEESNE